VRRGETRGGRRVGRLAAGREVANIRALGMTVDQIVAEARQLPKDLRAELLDRLGGALHGDAAPEVAAEWNQLALDRLAAVESGRSQLRPGEEVMARMRQLIGR
jgi:hypothetical protein